MRCCSSLLGALISLLLCLGIVNVCRASVGGLHYHHHPQYSSTFHHSRASSIRTSKHSHQPPKHTIKRRRGTLPHEYLLASTLSPPARRNDKLTVNGDDDDAISSYEELTWLGKIVAGVTEVAVTVIIEYAIGFVGGYFLGSLTGIPSFFMNALENPNNVPKNSFLNELGSRSLRLHRKSMSWATNLGGISAAFGGFRVAVRVCRNGKEDEWTTILSSMAAGAYFARSDGPQAMLRGAVLYGGLMYLLSGNLFGGQRRQQFEYKEEAMEF